MITYNQADEMLKALAQDNPYPALEITEQNINYANILMDDYAGGLGEMTAITQYIYEHIIAKNKEVSQIMRRIAIDEMRHLDLLGEMILQLGKVPTYTGSHEEPWCSEDVKYPVGNLLQAMQYNMYLEQKAIEGYEEAIRQIPISNVQRVLERIIADEKLHWEIFRRIRY